jgi:hypothetical protein
MGGMSVHGNRRRRWLALLTWLVFAAGLLVQLLSPHLKISNRAFVFHRKWRLGGMLFGWTKSSADSAECSCFQSSSR